MGYRDISFDKNSIFLVTGAAGFIGSNLVEAILDMGCKVRGVDNLSIGNKAYVDEFMYNPNYEFTDGDIRDYNLCLALTENVDYVLHNAAWGNVPRSIEMPLLYEEINVKGTLNMLEASRLNFVKKFVYASCSSVYGDNTDIVKVEGKEGTISTPYALNKKMDEEYGMLYKSLYELDTYGFRYFNVFGRRQEPDSAYAAVIPKFIKELLNKEVPTINGDGNQLRNFTYIDNVIEANFKALKSESQYAGKTYNIGTGESISINEIYKKISSLLDVDIKPLYGVERQGDVKNIIPDISKAKELLEYNPQWDLDEGLKETIEWFKNNSEKFS